MNDPRSFGVVELDEDWHVVGIEEKPVEPKNNYAVPGIYFYENEVVDVAADVKPSDCGELKITNVNNAYLVRGNLRVGLTGGIARLDTGTPESSLKASEYVETVQPWRGYHVDFPR